MHKWPLRNDHWPLLQSLHLPGLSLKSDGKEECAWKRDSLKYCIFGKAEYCMEKGRKEERNIRNTFFYFQKLIILTDIFDYYLNFSYLNFVPLKHSINRA